MNHHILNNHSFIPFKFNTAFDLNTNFKSIARPKVFDDYSKNSVFFNVKKQNTLAPSDLNSTIVFPQPTHAKPKIMERKEEKKAKNQLLMNKFLELKARNSAAIHNVKTLEEELNANFDKLLNIYDKVEKIKKVKKEKRRNNNVV